jgi:hypothetical protein
MLQLFPVVYVPSVQTMIYVYRYIGNLTSSHHINCRAWEIVLFRLQFPISFLDYQYVFFLCKFVLVLSNHPLFADILTTGLTSLIILIIFLIVILLISLSLLLFSFRKTYEVYTMPKSPILVMCPSLVTTKLADFL